MKRLLAAFLLLLACGAFWAYTRLSQPFAGFRPPVLIEFPKGTSTAAMAERLHQVGVIESPAWFLLARIVRPGVKLQAGEYEFRQPASPLAVLDRIARGDVHYYEVAIPEGANIFDMAKLAQAAGVGTSEEFLQEARNVKAHPEVNANAESLEGYLFPATYRFTKGTTSRQLCRMMTARFKRAWTELGATGNDTKATVTLASLVEKEAAAAADRPLIASVFANRLKRGMTLDCDPTVIYAALLENKFRGTIYRSDLDRNSPYNTYRTAGLPPGPIANPGMESLKAAVHPAESDYLFFVAKADGSGTHVFSKTMAEHNRAVLEYRRGLQKREQAGSATPAGRRPRAHGD